MKLPFRAWAALLAGLAVAQVAWAQTDADKWPVRPLTFVVPFPAGGITDSTSRLLAQKLGEKLGQQVVVDNKPGAGGSIGAEAVARMHGDGYTLLYGTQGTHGANIALYKNVRYDPLKDFIPVHGIAESPLVLVINANRPFKSVQDLIAHAKQNPGKLNYGSAGTGTGTHLTAELFQTTAGIKMTHVPYKGSSPALTDLAAGNVDLAFDYAAIVMPLVTAGKLRALAVTSKTRLQSASDVPTVSELGFPAAESSAWGTVYVPARTPPAIVKKLADALSEAIVHPDFIAATEKHGTVLMRGMRGDRLDAFVKSELTRWRDVVQSSGAKLE